MSANLFAEVKEQKIIIHMPGGKDFDLVPYTKTPDGDQQFFGIEAELERIVACINDMNAIPTETIKQGFVGRMMLTVNRAKQSVDMTKKVLEAVYAKEVKDQVESKSTDASAIPAKNTGQRVDDGQPKA